MIKSNIKYNNKEIIRKLIHVIFGLTLISLIYFEYYYLPLIIPFLAISIGASFFFKKHKKGKYYDLIKKYERSKDMNRFPGKGFITFQIGTLLTYLLFQKHIIIASLIILTIGDSTEHIIGRYFKKVKIFNNKKNIEGTIVAIIFTMQINFFIINYKIAIISSTIVMFIELFEFKLGKILFDDNLYLPVIAGIIITLLELLL